MAYELIYTSAPAGIRANVSGFCTVAMTNGLSPALVTKLESMVGYKYVYSQNDAKYALNPPSFFHYRLTQGMTTYDIVGRLCACKLDYTGRSNKLAHFFIIGDNEKSPAGPAALCIQANPFVTEWNRPPTLFPQEQILPSPQYQPRIAQQWKNYTGDAGFAGYLAQSFIDNPRSRTTIIFNPEQHTNLLELVDEAIQLLPQNMRWRVTYNTFLSTTLASDILCNWNFCPDLPQFRQSLPALFNGNIINLNSITQAAGDGPLQNAARTGIVETPQQTPATSHSIQSSAIPPTNAGSLEDLLKKENTKQEFPMPLAPNRPKLALRQNEKAEEAQRQFGGMQGNGMPNTYPTNRVSNAYPNYDFSLSQPAKKKFPVKFIALCVIILACLGTVFITLVTFTNGKSSTKQNALGENPPKTEVKTAQNDVGSEDDSKPQQVKHAIELKDDSKEYIKIAQHEAEKGDTINIEATERTNDGYEFTSWKSEGNAVAFDKATAMKTSFKMPAQKVLLSVEYKQLTQYIIRISAYTSCVSAKIGDKLVDVNNIKVFHKQKVTLEITKDKFDGKVFNKWNGNIEFKENKTSKTVSFFMPDHDVSITPDYVTVKKYPVYIMGNNDDDFFISSPEEASEGEKVKIEAPNNEIKNGKKFIFKKWESKDVTFENPQSPQSSFIMPSNQVTITILHEKKIQHKIDVVINKPKEMKENLKKVIKGNPQNAFEGDLIKLEANLTDNEKSPKYKFSHWEYHPNDDQKIQIQFNINDSHISFKMPDEKIELVAVYKKQYSDKEIQSQISNYTFCDLPKEYKDPIQKNKIINESIIANINNSYIDNYLKIEKTQNKTKNNKKKNNEKKNNKKEIDDILDKCHYNPPDSRYLGKMIQYANRIKEECKDDNTYRKLLVHINIMQTIDGYKGKNIPPKDRETLISDITSIYLEGIINNELSEYLKNNEIEDLKKTTKNIQIFKEKLKDIKAKYTSREIDKK